MEHLSTLTLHQLRYGELDSDEEQAARAHLAGCAHCSGILAAQENHRAEFALKPVPEALRELSHTPEPWWRRVFAGQWTGPLLAIAALLIIVPLVAVPQLSEEPEITEEPDTLDKGGIHLEAWLETKEGPRFLAEDAIVAAGDRIQLKYASQGRPFASFGGVDEQGNTEVYGTFSTDGEGIHNAPFALTLDNTPGRQRFFALFTWDEPDEETVRQSIQSGQAPRGGILRSISFRKD